MQIIPAIDVLDGRVVRLQQGDFARQTSFDADPATLAQSFASAGATALHLVNLSGARDGTTDEAFLSLVRRIARISRLELQVGGGIRSLRDMSALFEAGARRIVIGTLLSADPNLAREAMILFGTERIIAALDVRGENVCVQGWSEETDLSLYDALERVRKLGITSVLMTAIECDGMGGGPNVELYTRVCRSFPGIRVTASGGIRGPMDLRALRDAGCAAAVVGKALLSATVTFPTLLRAEASDLAVRVIPCLDVQGGRTVKGTNFGNLRDAGDPVERARRYCDDGADELVFLDICATKENRSTVIGLVRRVAKSVSIPFTVGGGVRSVSDAQRLLLAGADKVAVNSAAVRRPALLSEMAQSLGRANTVCAIDAQRKGNSWTVLTEGGTTDAERDALTWAEEAAERGAGELLVTSFDRDGTGAGFDTALLAAIRARVSIPVIASGGAGTMQSFVEAVRSGADAVLAASVFHFGTFRIRDVKRALSSASFPVRP